MTLFYKYNNLLACVVAFGITAMSIQLLRPLALRLGLVDIPGGRKNHSSKIPLIGGIAMFIGICFALLTVNISLYPYRGFIAGLALLVFVGVLDDFHELTARARFLAQITAGLLMVVWGKNYLSSFGNILFIGNIHLGWLALPITVFALVGVINAVNMLDGVDGLAGSVVLQQLLILSALAYYVGDFVMVKLLLILSAALAGFLMFNWHWSSYSRMKIFMGDAGSMLLGFSMAWFLVALSQGQHPAASPVTMLWIMALPLFDTFRLIIIRTISGKSPLQPGRDHIHHYLLDKGLPVWAVNVILVLVSFVFAVMGIIGGICHVREGVMFMLYLLFFVMFFLQLNFENIKRAVAK